MPIFSVPLDANRTRPSARAKAHPNPHRESRKRKRSSTRSSSPSSSQTESVAAAPTSDDEASTPTISVALRNPLALSPGEIRQYRAAGLAIDQDLNEEFWSSYDPLQALGRDSEFVKSAGAVPEEVGEAKIASLKLQHVTALTTVLMRCLQEGNIALASRAWALLLRVQVNGAPVELRESGYWGIGAELLIRAGEEVPSGRRGLDGRRIPPPNEVHQEDDDEDEEVTSNFESDLLGWGTKAGLDAAKDYYDRLILQYPYRRQFANTINSLDFWPAMLGCEIYGIQHEQKAALQRIRGQSKDGRIAGSDISLSEPENAGLEEGDDWIEAQERRDRARAQRNKEILWQKEDQIRRDTLAAAEKVALKMDKLMELPPFADSKPLLRLRGMLALYIGQLHVPSQHENENNDDDDNEASQSREARQLARQRRAEHERGLGMRSQQRQRALLLFERLQREGTTLLDEVIRRLSADEREATSSRDASV